MPGHPNPPILLTLYRKPGKEGEISTYMTKDCCKNHIVAARHLDMTMEELAFVTRVACAPGVSIEDAKLKPLDTYLREIYIEAKTRLGHNNDFYMANRILPDDQKEAVHKTIKDFLVSQGVAHACTLCDGNLIHPECPPLPDELRGMVPRPRYYVVPDFSPP
ncbi:hypothetical protein MMC27_000108 [Xylographa pallens]|nr:hypothetical protein [Xylographa pallens]